MFTYVISLFLSAYFIFVLLNGYFLYQLFQRFAEVKESRWAKTLLFATLMLSSGMVIWIGDNNFAMTLPFYMAGVLAATKGDLLGRMTVGGVFFCFIMTVCAMADTYLIPLDRFGCYDVVSRLVRPLAFGVVYLFFYRQLKRETIQLPHRLWKLCAGLTVLPFAALTALILPAYWMPESVLLHNLNWFQGTVILPMALLSSLVLLYSILVLADYEDRAQAVSRAEMREVYYQSLKREQTQVRTLRHDLRNHLNTVLGLLERGEAGKARQYLLELTDSQALHGSCHICENEIANVIISAKWEEMERCGIRRDIQAALPETLPVADTDLCALLGNALDNAIEGAKRSQEKWIVVRCRAERGLLMLRVENSAEGRIHGDLSTTKTDKKLHGFGLAGMREIAARYGGVLETGGTDSSFELVVSIPLAV